MRDYNINELIEILASHDSNEIYVSPHILENCFERNYSLIYPHETIKFQDLYIVIGINDDEKITIITVYCFDKRRREREIKR